MKHDRFSSLVQSWCIAAGLFGVGRLTTEKWTVAKPAEQRPPLTSSITHNNNALINAHLWEAGGWGWGDGARLKWGRLQSITAAGQQLAIQGEWVASSLCSCTPPQRRVLLYESNGALAASSPPPPPHPHPHPHPWWILVSSVLPLHASRRKKQRVVAVTTTAKKAAIEGDGVAWSWSGRSCNRRQVLLPQPQ